MALTVAFWIVPKFSAHFAGEFIPRFELVARLDEPLDLRSGDTGDRGEDGEGESASGRARARSRLDWMNIPFHQRFHDAIAGNVAAGRLAPRWPRLLATKKMQEWMSLPCFTAGWDSDDNTECYPVGVFLASEAPRIRVDSPGKSTPTAVSTWM